MKNVFIRFTEACRWSYQGFLEHHTPTMSACIYVIARNGEKVWVCMWILYKLEKSRNSQSMPKSVFLFITIVPTTSARTLQCSKQDDRDVLVKVNKMQCSDN